MIEALMRRIGLTLLGTLVFACPASAQVPGPGSGVIVVATCGTPPFTYAPGGYYAMTMDTTGKLCDTGAGGSSGLTSSNITQFGSSNVVTGAGAGGAGIPRVTVSNDSSVKVWDGTNTQTVKAASTAPLATDPAAVFALSPNGINPNGQGTKATSTPVVIASDQGTLSSNSYSQITTATTTTVKSGAGVLHTVCVNSLGTVASAVTVDDALSATTPTIAVINSLALLGCQTYDVAFATGLTIVTTGTVAPNVTVSYR